MVQSRVELTITTFGTLLIAGADAREYALVKEVWAYLEQAGLEANPACINAYVQALVHQGEWSEAQKHFKHLLGRGSHVRAPIVTINTIMAAYMKQGMFDQVQQVFDDMYTAGLQPNIMTYITLLSSYAELGNWQHALQVLNHMCQPQVAIVPNTLAFNHVFEALHKAASQTCTAEARVALAENSVSLFNQMLHRGRPPPDCSTYDILAALLTEIGAGGQALHVCQLKRQKGLAASCAGLSSIIACCAQLGQWEQAYGAWSLMQMSGMQPDAACLNALLAALQAAQQWQHVIQVFQAARQAQVQLDAVTYNVVLTALLSAEQLQASLSIVNDMHAQHLSIGAASCDRLLLLLMLAGELEVACKVTQELLSHGQAPGAECLARLVHLLKDDSQVWKALQLIKHAHQVAPAMKLEANEYIYLAEKALSLFGMAPAVWLLVQLHTMETIHFYVLPCKASASPTSHSSSTSPMHSPRASPKLTPGLVTPQFDSTKPRGMVNSDDVTEGGSDQQGGAEAGQVYGVSSVALGGLSTDIAIVVVLSWAAQLAQLLDTAVVIQAASITIVLGGQDKCFDPTSLHAALTKLFRLHSEKIEGDLPRCSIEKDRAAASQDTQDKSIVALTTSHLYLWIEEHREILQNLLSEGQAKPLSPMLSNLDKPK